MQYNKAYTKIIGNLDSSVARTPFKHIKSVYQRINKVL